MRGDRVTLGVMAMIAFTAIAPVMDAFAKATPSEIPVSEILGFRFGVQVVILLPLAMFMGIAQWPTRREAALHLARALALVVATGLFFAAVRQMPIANAIAIFFVEPFILTIAGGLFLGEEVGPRRIAACVVGFLGALLVIQPSFSDLGPVALLPLGTAVCFAGYMILTRSMATRRHPVTVQAYTAVAAMILLTPLFVIFDGTGAVGLDPVWPQGFAWTALLGVGIVSTVSHLFLSVSLRLAPASTVAPLQYLEIIAATGIGYAFFGDFPNALTWAGIVIIVASGLYVFARERALSRSARRRPAQGIRAAGSPASPGNRN